MSKVVQRLLIFFVGIPIILGIVYIPFLHHLPFNIALIIASAIAAYELCIIFKAKDGETLPIPLVIGLSSFVLICEIIKNILDGLTLFNPSLYYALCLVLKMAFILSVIIIFSVEIFTAKTFEKSNARIVRSICVVLYCGVLPSYISRFTPFGNSFELLTTFLVLVFISDSAAWLLGVLFGKNNRGKIAASPNKSIAGFIGAYLGCILFAYLFTYLIFPNTFDITYHKGVKIFVLAVIVCTASIIGDLAESVFKRSANVKDSGKVIMGRGGMLDCVDSVFMAAPFFYTIIFLFGTMD